MHMSIFRDTEDQGYAYLPPRQVHAIAAAAVHKPYLSKDFQYENPCDKTLMECKCLVILGAAAAMNINHLILTPFGCGSCGNPPQLVAEMLLMPTVFPKKRREALLLKGEKALQTRRRFSERCLCIDVVAFVVCRLPF